MKEVLADIRRKLQDGSYKNEEHVRFALVGRVLQALGWDIWNPRQVYAEFVAVPDEDKAKVDFALFSRGNLPAVFIEVKNVGRATANLEETEKQLRDYNRNITALFCVITDGATWRFYYSKSQGQFSSKCFKVIDIRSDDLEDVELTLLTFLRKADIDSENAEKVAQDLLKLTRIQRLMEERLPGARRMTQEPPFPSLPDALVALIAEDGETATRKEAEEFISTAKDRSPPPPSPEEPPVWSGDIPPGGKDKPITLVPENPGSLAFTSIDLVRFGKETANNWNALVSVGLKMAVERGYGVAQLRKFMTAQVEDGSVTDRGFHPIPGTRLSLQYMQTDRAWENALALAKQMKCEIKVEFHWRSNETAAHPGRNGILHWSP